MRETNAEIAQAKAAADRNTKLQAALNAAVAEDSGAGTYPEVQNLRVQLETARKDAARKANAKDARG